MTDSSELAKQLEALQAALAEAKSLLAPLNDEQATLTAEKHAVTESFNTQIQALQDAKQAELNKIYEKQKALEPKLQQITSVIYTHQNELTKAEKELEAAIAAEEQAAKEQQEAIKQAELEKERRARWDKVTINAPWREWAKEHQMVGGRTLVEDRYVIEADPMGLGKTLTSIICVDMAERLSAEASPENPWQGIEVEKWQHGHWHRVDTGTCFLGKYLNYDQANHKHNNPDLWEHIEGKYVKVIEDAITRPVGKRVLYLCPSSLLTNVLSEFSHWAPHRNAIYIGGFTKAERNFALDMVTKVGDFVVICNYEAWRKDHSLLDTLEDLNFDTIIIDEAHNIKDMKTSAFRGVNRLVNGNKHGKRPEYVIPMTGTPVLNRPQELFPLLHLVNPKEFYRENDYLRNYCEQYYDDNGNPKWRFQAGGLERLTKRIRKNFMRRTREDAGIELPPKTITYHTLEVDEEKWPEQAEARKQMRDYATIVLKNGKGAISAMAKIAVFTRLRQIETWPAGIVQYNTTKDGKFIYDSEGNKEVKLQIDIEESQKLDYIIHYDKSEAEWEGLIPNLVADERIVVFSQFVAPLKELKRRIEASGYKAALMVGETSKEERDRVRIDFDNKFTPNRADATYDVVLCNYKVGGVGLNLTAATQTIILDEEWNPGKRDQAYDRIHRMGQDKPVTIHVIRNTPTIDNWLAGIMSDKDEIVGGFEAAVEKSTSADSILEALESGLI